MNYNKVIIEIDNFVSKNIDILQLLYPREGDLKYSKIINQIITGNNLLQLKYEISNFYRFQGMDEKQRINLLNIFDERKEDIKNITDIDKTYILYCELLEKTIEATDKCQYVNTSKLMHLYNRDIPLFDNNVINFLRILNIDVRHRTKETYNHILNIYYKINEQKNIESIKNIINIRNIIYSNVGVKHINLTKFVDTLMYSINDAKTMNTYKPLCEDHG